MALATCSITKHALYVPCDKSQWSAGKHVLLAQDKILKDDALALGPCSGMATPDDKRRPASSGEVEWEEYKDKEYETVSR